MNQKNSVFNFLENCILRNLDLLENRKINSLHFHFHYFKNKSKNLHYEKKH